MAPREFEGVLASHRRLRAASSDEYLKQLVIRFVAESIREDVRKAIGLMPARVELR